MQKSNRTEKIAQVLALVFVLGLTIYLYSIRDRVQELERYGYPGIFLFNLAANATLILPVPGMLFTSLMGGVFNPFWVAIAAGSGAALGEVSGYLAGFGGRGVAQRSAVYDRMEGWMKKYGVWAILFLAIIPNPLFDMAGMIAGALKVPLPRFLAWVWLGKVIKMLVAAYGGATILRIFPFF